MKKLLMIGVLLLSGSVFAVQPIDYTFQTSNPLDNALNTLGTLQRIEQNRINLQNQRLAREQYQQQLAELQDFNIKTSITKVTNQNQYCEVLQAMSIPIMKKRQLGYSASDVISAMGDTGNQEPYRTIALTAYQKPIEQTIDLKLQSVREYGNTVYVWCMGLTIPVTK